MPIGVYNHKPMSEESKRRLSERNKRMGIRPPSKLGVKMSEETKKKIGLANKGKGIGRKFSEETLKKLSDCRIGEKNHFYGKKHSDETKKKISEAKLKNPIRYWTGKRRQDMIGKNNFNWNGGSSFIGYSVDWTISLKRSIRERDKYLCKVCGEPQGDTAHDVHHIDYDKTNCDPKNLITLCHRCHMKTNVRRDYWKKYFKIIIEQIYAYRKL